MRFTHIPLLAISFSPLSSLSAQESFPIAPGQRVRVTVPDAGINLQVAEFEALNNGVLTLIADTTMRYLLAAVTRFDLYAGRQSHPWRGAGIGFLTGYALGFVLWYATGQSCYEGASTFNCAAVLGGGLGAVPGALIGAFIGGFAWKTDRWEAAPSTGYRCTSFPDVTASP